MILTNNNSSGFLSAGGSDGPLQMGVDPNGHSTIKSQVRHMVNISGEINDGVIVSVVGGGSRYYKVALRELAKLGIEDVVRGPDISFVDTRR